jgi:formylglycine-generating enzyme required for sulfatase activity
MDKYLVTVGRFRLFVNALERSYTPQAGSGKHTHLNGGNGLNATGGGYEPGWVVTDAGNVAPTATNLACSNSTWTNAVDFQGDSRPINCVNWYEAYAFCIWDGGVLPSEAEWEYAAAGGSQQREYPWGSTDPGTGYQYAIYGFTYPTGTYGSGTGLANIAPVGTAAQGAGLWGQLDLAGELWEWNLDFYAPYANCTDCADLSASSSRVNRGGVFYANASALLPSNRASYPPGARNYGFGFRCARSP